MEIKYKKLTEMELDTFINMRITQLTEEYTSEGKNPPEGVDLKTALEDFYHRHMVDGTFVSWLAMDGDKIIGTSGMCLGCCLPCIRIQITDAWGLRRNFWTVS